MLRLICGLSAKSEANVKTQISYNKLDGEAGVALVNGTISSTLQAKRELANKLTRSTAAPPADENEDIDARLRELEVDPGSVQHLHISE